MSNKVLINNDPAQKERVYRFRLITAINGNGCRVYYAKAPWYFGIWLPVQEDRLKDMWSRYEGPYIWNDRASMIEALTAMVTREFNEEMNRKLAVNSRKLKVIFEEDYNITAQRNNNG